MAQNFLNSNELEFFVKRILGNRTKIFGSRSRFKENKPLIHANER